MDKVEMEQKNNPDNMDQQKLMDTLDQFDNIDAGQIYNAHIVIVEGDSVYVDFGYKSEGRIGIDQFSQRPKVGDTTSVFLLSLESENGSPVVSKEIADKIIFHDELHEIRRENKTIFGKITKAIKGGFLVDVGLEAFLPLNKTDIKRIENPEELVGLESDFLITELELTDPMGQSKRKNRIVLNRSEVLRKRKEIEIQNFFDNRKKDDVIEGMVAHITNYGAFIDMGGVSGLLHINDLSWAKIKNVNDVLAINDRIKVIILNIDKEKHKISLGLKQLTPNPWDTFSSRYTIDQIVKGKVTSVTSFGAFVEIEAGVEGLVHISEMSWVKRVQHPKEIVRVNDVIEVKILNFDMANQKLSLGIKQILPNPWNDIDKKYPFGKRVKGKVKKVVNFAAFVELEDEIEGILRIDDLSWTENIEHPNQMVDKGKEMDLVVVGVDNEKKQIKLSLKQLEKDPWKILKANFPKGSIITGVIQKIEKEDGIFVQLENNITGIIFRRQIGQDMSDKEIDDKLATMKSGDEIKAVVISIEPKKKRVLLSIRDYQQRLAEIEVAKYLDDDSKSSTVSLGDILKKRLNE